MTANCSSSPRDGTSLSQGYRKFPFRSCFLLTLVGILLASCIPTQPSDPVSVVQAAYDRLNEGDLDGYMEFLSDDAVFASQGFRSADSQAIRAHLEINTVQPHMRTEISNISSDGNFVTFTYDEFEAKNHLAGPFDDGLTVVVDGKIIFDGTKGYLIIECNQDPSQAFCPEN